MLGTLLASILLIAQPTNQPPPGFAALFNGHDLQGWHGWNIHAPKSGPLDLPELASIESKLAEWNADAKKHWSVQNGELVNDGHGAYLCTDKDYRDYELLLEYKTVPLADSGIYLKATPQVQIWDYTEKPKFNIGADKGSGGLWNNSAGAKGKDPLVLADKPFGEWNKFRIFQIGERTTVWLNGKLVVDDAVMENFWDRKRRLFPKGPILLQTHGGEIRWRNMFIREIPTEEANTWLRMKSTENWSGSVASSTAPAEHHDVVEEDVSPRRGLLRFLLPRRGRMRRNYIGPNEPHTSTAHDLTAASQRAGFHPVFDGTDFAGWAGPIDNYEVKDGAIVCRPNKGGTIYTQEEFSDFVVRLEYKLPPGGNNGLAIRYPGHGDTAYVGMCEVQVLDDTHPMYAKLDKRQYNGSVYGMIAAQTGYLRQVGEWNYEEVTVKGPKIKVELNGTVIIDGDVSKVTQFMANSPHPGKDRPKGHFGFAGHNDPVMFRKIEIKKLD